MNIIKNLPSDLQNKIFYYCIDLHHIAKIFKNINWYDEYKKTFYRLNIYEDTVNTFNVFGNKYYLYNTNPRYSNFPLDKTLINLSLYKEVSLYKLRQSCKENGIKKFNKRNKKKMIKLLMKV